ncbi:hypothetical protein WG908_08895 [Sphingobium sp. AN641]|uniref:hypothetical protein n=1 Tax=Sphingobium sp. AN641 TaxID=3133443 RepID=UPI0030BD51F2
MTIFASLRALLLPAIAPGKILPTAAAAPESGEGFAAMMTAMGDAAAATPAGTPVPAIPAADQPQQSSPSLTASVDDSVAPPLQLPDATPVATSRDAPTPGPRPIALPVSGEDSPAPRAQLPDAAPIATSRDVPTPDPRPIADPASVEDSVAPPAQLPDATPVATSRDAPTPGPRPIADPASGEDSPASPAQLPDAAPIATSRDVPAPDPRPIADPASEDPVRLQPVGPVPAIPELITVGSDPIAPAPIVATVAPLPQRHGLQPATTGKPEAESRPEAAVAAKADKPRVTPPNDGLAVEAMTPAPVPIPTPLTVAPERTASHAAPPASSPPSDAIVPPPVAPASRASNGLPIVPTDEVAPADPGQAIAAPPKTMARLTTKTAARTAHPAGHEADMALSPSATPAQPNVSAEALLAQPDDAARSASSPSPFSAAPLPVTTVAAIAPAIAAPIDDRAPAAPPAAPLTLTPRPIAPPPAPTSQTAALPGRQEGEPGNADGSSDPQRRTPSLSVAIQPPADDKRTAAPPHAAPWDGVARPEPVTRPAAATAPAQPVQPVQDAVGQAGAALEIVLPSASPLPQVQATIPTSDPAMTAAPDAILPDHHAALVGTTASPVAQEPAARSEALSLLQLVRDHFARRKPADASPAGASADGPRPVGGMATPVPAVVPMPPAVAATIITAPPAPLPLPVNDIGGALAGQAVDMGVQGQWIDGLAREIASLSTNGGQGNFQIRSDQLGPVQVAIRQGPLGADISLTVASAAAEHALRQDSDRLRADAALSAVRVAEVRIERAPAADPARSDPGQQTSSQQNGSTAGGSFQGAGPGMGQGMSQGRSQAQENLSGGHKASADAAVLDHVDAREGATGGASAPGRARYA